MRQPLFAAFLVCAVALPIHAGDHQTARVEIAAGATLELLTRTPDLGMIADYGTGTRVILEEDPESGVTREGNVETIMLAIASTLWGRASLSAVASGSMGTAGTMVRAIAKPGFLLYNNLDTPMEVRFRVTVPGMFPGESEPNAFFWRSSIDNNYYEVSHAFVGVSVLGGPRVSDVPYSVVDVRRETRPAAGPPPGTPDGPAAFDLFGVPFRRDYSVTIPPAHVAVLRDGEWVIELVGDELGLRVFTEGFVLSALPSDFPLTFAEPDLCAVEPSREVDPLTPTIRDRLCNVGREGGASSACSCNRDDARREQRCAFTFPDLFVTLQIPAPVLAGQSVDAEWTILPWATEGDYSLVPELWDGRKWIPLETRSKLGGKLIEGKPSKAKLTFPMPSTPVLLRTRVFHQPEGAKSPIESYLDTTIALRKPIGK